ncbi:MAG TPA: haloacid dehalogenase type II [Stellaceae bacterium]|nr:haloacid dehalogenase type II [Stellaceae bacterium]
MSDPAQIRALVFDVFGTVVDWRGSVIRELAALGRAMRIEADWPAFADAWRAGYQPAMQRVREGALGWTGLDRLHRMILDDVLARFGIDLAEDERNHLNLAWHRLDPWPDAVEGLTRLKRRFVIGTLSNGGVGLLVAMAKRAGLPWDVVFSAELVRRYKPDPETYLMVPSLLGVAPAEVMMVAAHTGDLEAARRQGLRTGYVSRPLEHGKPAKVETVAQGAFDVVAGDFGELAGMMGA